MKHKLLLLTLSSSFYFATAQPAKQSISPVQYIAQYRDDAITDMIKTGVPASITLAQGMYESQNGNSPLAREANNHFGIKCHNEWKGETFHQDDDAANECFRKYNSVLESFDDHSAFLRERDRYKFLFEYDVTDYKKWAHGLKKAGYATNPAYAHKIIKFIEEYKLDELDKQALAQIKDGQKNKENDNSTLEANINKTPVIASKSEKPKTVSFNTEKINMNIKAINGIPFIRARKNDSYLKLAQEHDLMLWQILKYNDASKGDTPQEGEIVFLKPKKATAKQNYHIVEEGESMRSISQIYGVKLRHLYSKNNMEPYSEPVAGQKIILKGNKN